jgi:creatinine amidohydrolase
MTAKSQHKVRLGELTGGEAREILASRPVILVPLGSHEDQGPHAPMGDCLFAKRIAELIAERANSRGTVTLVAPVVPFGGPIILATSEPFSRTFSPYLLRHRLTRLIVIMDTTATYPSSTK